MTVGAEVECRDPTHAQRFQLQTRGPWEIEVGSFTRTANDLGAAGGFESARDGSGDLFAHFVATGADRGSDPGFQGLRLGTQKSDGPWENSRDEATPPGVSHGEPADAGEHHGEAIRRGYGQSQTGTPRDEAVAFAAVSGHGFQYVGRVDLGQMGARPGA